MATEVPIPDHLLRDVRKMVEQGKYPDVPTALTDLVRLGMEAKKQQESGGGGGGGMPGKLPDSERPTSTDPSDVNWM